MGRSIVSKQEARVCDLENKLEFQRGQVKRFEVRVNTAFNFNTYTLHFLDHIWPTCTCCVGAGVAPEGQRGAFGGGARAERPD